MAQFAKGDRVKHVNWERGFGHARGVIERVEKDGGGGDVYVIRWESGLHEWCWDDELLPKGWPQRFVAGSRPWMARLYEIGRFVRGLVR